MGSFNYVPSDAYEIAISTSSNKFMNCGTVTGTVKGIYPSGTSSRCALDDNTVIITARGSKISTIKGYFSVGQTVSISTKLTASSNSSFWANCEEAIGGQCLVMQNGSITNDLGASVGANSHQYPTSILGYKSDGTVMMTMVTSDSNGNYVGLRFNRIPDFCRAVGYDTCLLLDGGGSTTMVTLENGTYVERACYSDGVIRYVWNSLALVYTDAGVVPNSLKSVVFDATYYANNNSDLKAAFGNDAAKLYNHFLDFGIKEGRQASPNFSIKYYTEANSDLKAAFGTDYVKAMKHFVEFGKNEVRKTAPPADIGNNADFRINVNGLAVGLSGTNVVTATKAINASEIWTFIKNADDLCLKVFEHQFQRGSVLRHIIRLPACEVVLAFADIVYFACDEFRHFVGRTRKEYLLCHIITWIYPFGGCCYCLGRLVLYLGSCRVDSLDDPVFGQFHL